MRQGLVDVDGARILAPCHAYVSDGTGRLNGDQAGPNVAARLIPTWKRTGGPPRCWNTVTALGTHLGKGDRIHGRIQSECH